MEQPEKANIEDVVDNLKEYVNTRYELLTLKAGEKTANIGSQLILGLVLLFSFVLFVLFLSIGAGFYLAAVLGSAYAGFMLIAGFYLLLILILALFRKGMILKPLRNKIIRELFKEN